MMARFYAYVDKVFRLREWTATLTDSRPKGVIPAAAIFDTAFAMFATGCGSLNGIDQQRHFPGRLQKRVGRDVPSGDTVGRVYACLETGQLREVLREVHFRLKRNKILQSTAMGWFFAAVDGHEFFRQSQTLLRGVPHPHRESG
jgi:hypothetical protein